MNTPPPQITYPVVLDPVTGVSLCDQGSGRDVRGTALSALRIPLGHHDSLPDLGAPELVGVDVSAQELEAIARDVVTRHDDRADVLSDAELRETLAAAELGITSGE